MRNPLRAWSHLVIAASISVTTVAFAQSTTIRVGYTITTDITSAALFSAQKKGLFKQAGLDVQTQPFVQSSQKYDAFKGKAIDVDINAGESRPLNSFRPAYQSSCSRQFSLPTSGRSS